MPKRSKVRPDKREECTKMVKSLVVLSLWFQLAISFIDTKNAHNSKNGLELKNVGDEEVQGCWTDLDQVFLSMCFDISSNLIRITTSLNGEVPLALYYTNNLRNIHYIQVLGSGILRYRAVDIRLARLVSNSITLKAIKRKFKKFYLNSLRDLYFFLKRIATSGKTWALTGTERKRVLTKNETVALAKLSSAFSNHLTLSSRLPKAIKRFHLLCLGLIQSVGPLGSYEKQLLQSSSYWSVKSKKVQSSANGIASLPSTNQMRLKRHYHGLGNHDNELLNQEKLKIGIGCQDMRNASIPGCFGMCGPRCWCWDWVCEDCCLHQACLEHDTCCRHAKPVYFSTFCLLPFIYGFDCKEGYKGYPRCLRDGSSSIDA